MTAAVADLSEARRLLGAGLRLVKMKPFTKQPDGVEWNLHPVSRIDGDATGYGLILAPNKLCSIDPDNAEVAKVGLRALGFDLEMLMDAGVRTRSTRPGSGGRSTFAADGEISWLKFSCGRFGTVIEFRADSPNLQDTIPGIVYRDKAGALCRQEYANCKRLDDAPALPDDLLEWWELCSTDVEFLRKQQEQFFAAVALAFGEVRDTIKPHQAISTGKGGKKLAFDAPNVRGPFNRRHSVPEILERHGYTYHQHLDRWSCPTASGAPGIRQVPGHDGLWRSDHASDPLHGTFDAWTAHVVLDHGGDIAAAIRASEPAPPPIDEDPGFDPADDAARVSGSTSDPGAQTQPEKPRREVTPFPLIDVAELLTVREPPRYVIGGLVEEGARVGFVAPPESAKSLLALHLAGCVATGRSFHGRSAVRGLAVYLFGEGQHGAARRVQALEAHYRLGLAGAPLVISKVATSLLDPVEVARIRDAIRMAESRFELPLALLVVDTVARFIAPGDESKAQDMGAYIAAVDGLAGRAAAISCHHPGHGDSTRGRGSSSWKAALDTEYTLAAVDAPAGRLVTVTCQKMKDGPKPEPLSFRVQTAPTLAQHPDGTPVQSVVLVTTEPQPLTRRPTGKNQKLLLAELEERAPDAVAWTEGELREIARNIGMGKQSARDAVLGLRQLGYLVATVGGSRLATMPSDGKKERNRAERQISAQAQGTETGQKAPVSLETVPSALRPVPADRRAMP